MDKEEYIRRGLLKTYIIFRSGSSRDLPKLIEGCINECSDHEDLYKRVSKLLELVNLTEMERLGIKKGLSFLNDGDLSWVVEHPDRKGIEEFIKNINIRYLERCLKKVADR